MTLTKHSPYYKELDSEDGGKCITYIKTEINDDFLFRKTNSISINSEALKKCEAVLIDIVHRGVMVCASKKEIEKYADIKTFHSESKYYYPVQKWTVLKGESDWYRELFKNK